MSLPACNRASLAFLILHFTEDKISSIKIFFAILNFLNNTKEIIYKKRFFFVAQFLAVLFCF